MRVLHLIRRTAHSLWPSLSEDDLQLVRDVLSEEELVMWSAMQVADRAHSLQVTHCGALLFSMMSEKAWPGSRQWVA